MRLGQRLALARIYWRHCACFHFAHKPLCARYRADVIRLGGFRLCRSCTCLWLGILAGVLAWLWLPGLPPGLVLRGYLAVFAGGMLLSLPRPYKLLPRPVRDLLRFAGGAVIACTPYIAWRVSPAIGLACLAALLLFRHYYLRSELRRRHAACPDCPALAAGGVCPGFALQTERLRRYEQEATDYLYASGYTPPGLPGPR